MSNIFDFLAIPLLTFGVIATWILIVQSYQGKSRTTHISAMVISLLLAIYFVISTKNEFEFSRVTTQTAFFYSILLIIIWPVLALISGIIKNVKSK